MAQNFKCLKISEKNDEIIIDEMIEDDEEVLIVSGMGIAEGLQGNSVEFIVSCKFSEEKIKETRMKFVWG